MDKIIPSFKKSLFDGSKEIIGDLTEYGIDSLLDDGLFKSFPIVSFLVGVKNTCQNIHDRNLLKQTLQFIKEFNVGTLSPELLDKYKKNIDNNSKKLEEELGRVIILLNGNIELEKSKMIANLFRNYINNKISWDEFCEFSEIVKMLFVKDINYLRKIYSGEFKRHSIVPDYVYNRLVSLGLTTMTLKGLYPDAPGSLSFSNEQNISLSKIGVKFYQSIILS